MKQDTDTVVPIVQGVTTDQLLYGIRYRQGGRTVYLTAMTPAEIINNVPRPNPDVPNPGNRKIRPKHARDFAEYYLEHANWVSPGIILRSPNIFKFDPDAEMPDGVTQFGKITYPKRKQNDIQILDAQHRILGFHEAQDKLDAAVVSAKDKRQKIMRVDGKEGAAFSQIEREIRDLEKLRDRMHSERVAVEIQITDDGQAYRQMFYDIAENALGIRASEKVAFDSRKVVNRAYPLVSEHPLLAGRIDQDYDRLGRSSQFFLTANHVVDIIRVSNVGIEGRVGRVMEKEWSEQEVANKAIGFFDTAVKAFPALQEVMLQQLQPDELRKKSLLGSPVFLRILAALRFELKENHAWPEQSVSDFFTALEPHTTAPVHENSIWLKNLPEDTFNVGGYAPNGRRQDIVNTYRGLLEWALDKSAVVYSAPEPAPEPEPTEDEAPIAYFDLEDAALAKKLAEEDIELGIVKPKRAPRTRKTA